MRVFVTGATGFVGSAVVRELIDNGHEVLGLARSDAGAAALERAGAAVLRGTLDDVDGLRRGAMAADGVIHAGFQHDFSRFAESCALDRRAIEALGAALEGSAKPLLVTSGLALVAPGRLAVETDAPHPILEAFPRASEHAAEALAARGVHASIVRLPPSVHDAGDHGFVPMLIGIARDKGVSVYAGDGTNRWPAVHRVDAARLYRLALERAAIGARYHAVAEDGIPFHAIAAVIARRLDVPLESRPAQDAAAHFGWFHRFTSLDAPAASTWTRNTLDWHPRARTLLDDIDSERYFPT
ncbi:SDR family oxidoreductase [uncultured Massilia sp.]|uniref:SDR family oxidoreductase n=1 Tax=uncultured Massilia sp. TaxID=169973 RepID=UPI0025DEF284|nr:SDR family oxidoreductase [uncultured Massilia sp.]